MTDEARTLALGVLDGTCSLPRLAPQREALGLALPSAVEERLCTRGIEPSGIARALRAIRESLSEDELEDDAFGTPTLAAGWRVAADLLGAEIPERVPAFEAASIDGYRRRRARARPNVYAPLVNDAPARVFHTAWPVEPHDADGATRETAALVQRLLGIETPRWALDRGAPGRSKTAALFLRALLERCPEALQKLTEGGEFHGPIHDAVPLGITGELDAHGVARPVDGLADKVRRFFESHPEGRLLVPAAQWSEAVRAWSDLASEKRHGRDITGASGTALRLWRLVPFRGAQELMIRLGVATEAAPETTLFHALRQAFQRVTCWDGQVREVAETLEPRYQSASAPREPKPAFGPGAPETYDERALLERVGDDWLSGRSRTLFIEGGPGSGKSVALHRLAAAPLAGERLFGPAIRVSAKDLVRTGFSLARALHATQQPEGGLDFEACNRLIALARTPTLDGGVWLLLDGLDEVSADERRVIREFAHAWSGPVVFCARPLPNEVAGLPHVRIEPLDSRDQRILLELLGKPGHARLLAHEDAWSVSEDGPRIRDRRPEMLADLCATPLGLSLLAMFPESELGRDLDVPAVLKRSLVILLERAEARGRIFGSVRRKVVMHGLPLLGAAAWSMLRRAGATLTSDDLARMCGDEAVVDAVWDVVEKSDLVQRVGPDAYQFSHKSLAEFCAALHLLSREDSEPEMLARVGEPGADAVAFHWAALTDPARLTAFVEALLRTPHRPMSSLALATRLLVANGPERVLVEVTLEVFVRRARLFT